jgi:putative transposase
MKAHPDATPKELVSSKRSRARELIGASGAGVWYLPPYSPDLNPIENVFGKIKQRLRTLSCRTHDRRCGPPCSRCRTA